MNVCPPCGVFARGNDGHPLCAPSQMAPSNMGGSVDPLAKTENANTAP